MLGLIALRIALAGLLAAHGWYRFLQGGVAPFGEWLTSQGIPFGPYVAGAVTAWEIIGTPLLAVGWRVPWLCLGFAAIYATGLVMVHLPEGWFVVGGGRNNMEYSVLLLVCLGVIGFTHLPERPVLTIKERSRQGRAAATRDIDLLNPGGCGGSRDDPTRNRYGCFLPDLTGLATASSARLPRRIWAKPREGARAGASIRRSRPLIRLGP